MYTLTEKLLKLIIFFLVFHTTVFAKTSFSMKNAANNIVHLRLAISKEDQTRGLSGLRPADFKNNEGMLFINAEESPRTFWMIDTYFNLDIIFLDKNLTIVGMEKNVPAHPGKDEPPLIFRTNTYQSQFVLETKSDAPFCNGLKIKDRLKFIGKPNLSEITLKIRQTQ
jgi:uncharacterized membrane protein (UPF0127 family)